MQTLVFATNNQHKLQEVRQMLGNRFDIKSLADIGCDDDIPETADSLQGNALQKARFVKERFGLDCFADDTGLECFALDGAPGIFSARYAGDNHDSEANMTKKKTTGAHNSERLSRYYIKERCISSKELSRETSSTSVKGGRDSDTTLSSCPRGSAKPLPR